MEGERMAAQATEVTPPAIAFRAVTKCYGPTTVVDSVDLAVSSGKIHALVGANGAGKSTLLGMLSGRTEVTSGTIEVFGEPLVHGGPRAAMARGIATVYQELSVIGTLSAAANVFLGGEQHKLGWLSEREMEARFRELCREFGVDIDPRTPVVRLSVAFRQLIEIMRAIRAQAKVILLDEPTAALSESEREVLLRLVTQLSERGVTIILVSHNLGEVLSISHTISVMRAGKLVRTADRDSWDRSQLIHAMTGEVTAPPMRDERAAPGEVMLAASGVTVPGAIEDIAVTVRAGEIVGLAGLVGSGRTSLLRALAGAEPAARGELRIAGQPQRWPRSVRDAIRRCGIALVPEDRKAEGLHLLRNVPDNVTVTRLGSVTRSGFVSQARQLARATELLDDLQISRPVGDYPAGELSGGNQQKVAIAKWLHRSPPILLFDEPTRGIDVVAKVQVMAAIRRYAQAGHAVIVTSSEVEEVLDLADRLIVLSRGRAVADLDLHERVPTVREVLEYSFERTG
jgi:ABC-type sugar transport system ATPase subunit